MDDDQLTVGDVDESVSGDAILQALSEVSQVNQTDTVAVSEDIKKEVPPMGTPETLSPQPVQNEVKADIPDIGMGTSPTDDHVILPQSVQAQDKIDAMKKASEEIKDTQTDTVAVSEDIKKNQIVRDEKGRIVKPVPQDTNKNGKAGRKTVVDDEALLKLEQAFLMGCDDEEACQFAGISPSALYAHQRRNPEFQQEKELWKLNPILKATATVYKNLSQPEMARWFLERRKKDKFSTRQELVGASDGSAQPIKIEYVVPTAKPEPATTPTDNNQVSTDNQTA